MPESYEDVWIVFRQSDVIGISEGGLKLLQLLITCRRF